MNESNDFPERLTLVKDMWNDKFDIGEEFDYCGITMVRADTEEPMFYPKRVGKNGLINVTAIPSATGVEHEIHQTIAYFEDP